MEDHIVRSFDGELGRLHDQVVRMGAMASHQFAEAIDALEQQDSTRAAAVGPGDDDIDALERAISEQAVRVLALRSPVAVDLRAVITALKMASTVERVGDYAASIARRSMVLNGLPPLPPVRPLLRMARLTQRLLDDALAAYATRDADKAHAVWACDKEIDDQYASLFRQLLTFMMEDPRTIAASSHLLFIAKHVERVGDLSTNIGEMAYYLVTGHPMNGQRPKGNFATGEE